MIEFQLWIRMIRHHPGANNHVEVDHVIRWSQNISDEESGVCWNLLEREPHGVRSEHRVALSVTVTVSEIEIQWREEPAGHGSAIPPCYFGWGSGCYYYS